MIKKRRFSTLYLAFVFVLMYMPIALVVIYSFNESKISSIWGGFSLTWYEKLFNNSAMIEAFFNSLILAGSSCLLAAIIGTAAALGMPKAPLRGKGAVEYISMLPIMIPEIILGMIFLAFFSLLQLPFGMLTLIIAHTAFCIPYIYMTVKARLVGMDKSIIEAARDLGASPFRVFFDVTLPLITPAILSGALLAFAMSFDDVIISLFVTGVSVQTLPILVYTQIKTGVTPEINALCTIILVATILIVFISSRINKKGKVANN